MMYDGKTAQEWAIENQNLKAEITRLREKLARTEHHGERGLIHIHVEEFEDFERLRRERAAHNHEVHKNS